MFWSKGNTVDRSTHLYDRLSWCWLLVGALLLPFTVFQTMLPIAAWLAPLFLLRFLRTQRPVVALPVIALVQCVAMLIAFRGILPAPANLMVAALGLVAVIPYMADALLGKRLSGIARTLVFPLTVVCVDWLLGLGPLGAATTAAYSQYGNLALMQIVSVTGIWGLTFLITWLAPVANDLWEHSGDWRAVRPQLVLFVAALLAVVLFGSIRIAFAPATTPTVRVAGLTHDKALWESLPSGTVDVAKSPDAQRATMRPFYQRILDDLLLRTRQEARAGAKIVVWSEVAAHLLKEDEPNVLEQARTVARQEGIYLQIALNVILHSQQFPFAENRAILIDPAGTILWDYHKSIHPLDDKAVYAPGAGILPSTMTPFGRLVTAICFDADYPALLRQAGLSGAGLLLLPAHDWDSVKTMHMQINAVRAIENGVALFRPTGDGVSLAMDRFGRVVGTVDDFATVKPALVVDMPMQGVPTIYAKMGDLFVYLCTTTWLTLVGAAILRWRSVNGVLAGEALQV